MKNKEEEVIYVGKAKRLKQRVTSYFNQSVKSVKTEYMVNQVRDFEFFITQSEVESYVLENNLIKKHTPKYNIRLRDDKTYPYIEISQEDEFPRLVFTRKIKRDKKRELFGPFPNGSGLVEALRAINKAFHLRDCSDYEFKSRKTPCLLYQMHQCSAPCVKLISPEDYQQDLKLAKALFLGGKKSEASLKMLYDRLTQASEQEEFEKAAFIHEQIKQIEFFLHQLQAQSVESLRDEKNADIWGLFVGNTEWDLSVYQVRRGSLLGQRNFHFPLDDIFTNQSEDIITFLLQYYSKHLEDCPQHIILDCLSSVGDFQQALDTLTQGHIRVWSGSKKYQKLIEMAVIHARESQKLRQNEQASLILGLKKLQTLLKLKHRPEKIECYDVAIWQGQSPTASQVVSLNGILQKNLYRYYHLKTRPEGNNDFAMMKEVVQRRIEHGELPDIFLIDGGVAQVNTVEKVLQESAIAVPVIGIAKAKDIHRGNWIKEAESSRERLIIPGRLNHYYLDQDPSLAKIIIPLRDEAHRFSRKLHHKMEKKRVIKSWTDELKGLSSGDKKLLLAKLDLPLEELKKIPIEELETKFKLNVREKKALVRFLKM